MAIFDSLYLAKTAHIAKPYVQYKCITSA